MKAFIEALKKHLTDNKSSFVQVDEWCGSTEQGFWDEEHVDMDALMREIDEFSATFTQKNGHA